MPSGGVDDTAAIQAGMELGSPPPIYAINRDNPAGNINKFVEGRTNNLNRALAEGTETGAKELLAGRGGKFYTKDEMARNRGIGNIGYDRDGKLIVDNPDYFDLMNSGQVPVVAPAIERPVTQTDAAFGPQTDAGRRIAASMARTAATPVRGTDVAGPINTAIPTLQMHKI